MSKCITCGASFNGTESDLAKLFKDQFDKYGTVRWVYRLHAKDGFKFAKSESWKVIYQEQIKNNPNGEYFHIAELK